MAHWLLGSQQCCRIRGICRKGGGHALHHHRCVPIDVPNEAALPSPAAARRILLLGVLQARARLH